MARIRSGNLDRRITIQVASTMKDSFGQEIPTWAEFKVVWAALMPLTGDESFVAEQRSARAQVKFKIRYLANVTPKMRVLHRSDTYEIDDVSEQDRNHEIVLTCHAFEVKSGA